MKRVHKVIGRRIADQRRLMGLTQAGLAERVKLAPETVSRLENGTENASIGTIAAVADGLGLALEDLFRMRPRDSPEERAIDHLVWLVSRRTVKEIDLITTMAAGIFDLLRARDVGAPAPKVSAR